VTRSAANGSCFGRTDNCEVGAASRPAIVRTVLIAFGANLLVAMAKSIAALVTGSASMLAEAAHPPSGHCLRCLRSLG
jgi:Co/Zn/Cd efflux system component